MTSKHNNSEGERYAWSLLGCSEDGVKLFFERFALAKRPVGLFLVTKDDVIQHSLRHAHCGDHLAIHFYTL